MLDLKGLFEDLDGINKVIAIEMLISFFNGILDKSIPFYLLRHTFKDVIDFLVVFAGRIVVSIYGFLKFERFLIRSVGPVWW